MYHVLLVSCIMFLLVSCVSLVPRPFVASFLSAYVTIEHLSDKLQEGSKVTYANKNKWQTAWERGYSCVAKWLNVRKVG